MVSSMDINNSNTQEVPDGLRNDLQSIPITDHQELELTNSSLFPQTVRLQQHDELDLDEFMGKCSDTCSNILSPPSLSTGVSLPTSPSQTTSLSRRGYMDDNFLAFAHVLPFNLSIKTVSYPFWATWQSKPLHYLPVPSKQLPNIPNIPSELSISFTQIMDGACFADTIDGVLQNGGYNLSCHDVWMVYVSFTHSDGTRKRVAVKVDNINLIIEPWAKEVYTGHLPQVADNCTCETCKERNKTPTAHGLEVEVIFPQDSEMKTKQGGLKTPCPKEYWAGKEKLSPTFRKVLRKVTFAGVAKKLRF